MQTNEHEQNRTPRDYDCELTDIAVDVVELPAAIDDVLRAVLRAASELEGTSAKADRIAAQLLHAVAIFHRETGT